MVHRIKCFLRSRNTLTIILRLSILENHESVIFIKYCQGIIHLLENKLALDHVPVSLIISRIQIKHTLAYSRYSSDLPCPFQTTSCKL